MSGDLFNLRQFVFRVLNKAILRHGVKLTFQLYLALQILKYNELSSFF